MSWESILKGDKKYSYNQMKAVFDEAAKQAKGFERQHVSMFWVRVRPTILTGFDRDEPMYSEKEMREVKKKLVKYKDL